MLLVFTILCEYVACVYWGIFSRISAQTQSINATVYDAAEFLPIKYLNTDPGTQFVHSLYVTLTLLTGHGEDIMPMSEPALLFTIIVQLIGVGLIAQVIGSVGVLIHKLDAAAKAFEQKCEMTQNFVSRKHVPTGIQSRVTSFFECTWARGAAVDVKEKIADELHPPLRKELMTAICHAIISAVPIFRQLSDSEASLFSRPPVTTH